MEFYSIYVLLWFVVSLLLKQNVTHIHVKYIKRIKFSLFLLYISDSLPLFSLRPF